MDMNDLNRNMNVITILDSFRNQGIWVLSFNQILKWYLKHLDTATIHDGYLCRLRFNDMKLGGNTEIDDELIKISGINYQILIRKFDLIEEDGNTVSEIHIMTPQVKLEINGNVSKSKSIRLNKCIVVKIFKGHNVAEIYDVVGDKNCTDQPDLPEKAGRIYLSVIIDYLKRHKDIYQIQSIELSDTSTKKITGFLPLFSPIKINLEKSRQLEGQYPYYMDLNFQPKKQSARIKLSQNHDKMRIMKTSELNIDLLYRKFLHLKKEKLKIVEKMLENGKFKNEEDYLSHQTFAVQRYDRVLNYIRNNPDELMVHTNIYIRMNYQTVYHEIHQDLFDSCGLKVLIDDENVYTLDLNE